MAYNAKVAGKLKGDLCDLVGHSGFHQTTDARTGGLMPGLHENVSVSVFMCSYVYRYILWHMGCVVCYVGGKVTDGL